MTTQRTDRKARMTAAAAVRTAPDAPQAGATAIRTKPYRVTLDLAPADYAALNRWLASAAVEVDPDDPRRVSLASALRAMIHAATLDKSIGLVVIDLLRRERAT
jgi:hypothetical protein